MRNNINKHNILKLLLTKRKQVKKVKRLNPPNEYGLRKFEILKELKLKNFDFKNSYPELLKNEEIEEHVKDNEIYFCINAENGSSALSERKYIFNNRDIILNFVKDFVQIVVPVLAVGISFYLVKVQNESGKELKLLKNKVELQESTIKELLLNSNQKALNIK